MIDYSKYLIDDRFVIYLFHGVIPRNLHKVRNYTHKHITAEYFSKIIENLRNAGSAVSLPDIVKAHIEKRPLPKRSFAITFDDGFENNYSVAAPILRKYQVPATFYITTGFIESNSMSWIDMIEYAVEKMDDIEITSRYPSLNGKYTTLEQKKDLLDRIRRLVKMDRQLNPYTFATDFCQSLEIEHFSPDPFLDQKMNWIKICDLHKDPLFTIGGHSHTHRILAYLEQTELGQEIETSISKLQEHLECKITHYSYPEGLTYCYSDTVINELKKHGIVCAPTAEHGTNLSGDDLFRLKRIMVM